MSVTVISKKRVGTRKSEMADKVKIMHEKLVAICDQNLVKELARDERRDRRREFKLARMRAKLVA